MVPTRALGRVPSQVLVAAVLTAVLLTAVLVMSRTRAAFTGATGDPGSHWASGTVVIGDDDAGSALFTASGLLPGDTGERCIKVTYTGTLPATVKLYATGLGGSLGGNVDLVVQQATAGGNTGSYGAGCAGFSGTQLYAGTLAGFASTATGHASGVGTFAPTGPNQYLVYRFVYTLDAATPSAMQGQSATVTFTWESRS